MALLDDIRAMLIAAVREYRLPDSTMWMFDGQLNELSMMLGGSERIQNTPIPYPYSVLLHRTIYLYCFLLPFGLVDSIGYATPVICVFVAYTLFALEAIAQQVAEPFGTEPNSLALDSITRNVERSVYELCGLPLPEPISAGRDYQVS
jgi:putative membrane protein